MGECFALAGGAVGLVGWKSNSRSPSGMTTRKTTATAHAIARALVAWRFLEGADEGDCGEVLGGLGFDEG
jgi:hypothetical protein